MRLGFAENWLDLSENSTTEVVYLLQGWKCTEVKE